MPAIFLTAEAHFDAAHRLEYYPGKCSQLHGHRWTIQATMGPFFEEDLDMSGLAIDFKKIKQALDAFAEKYDHQYINDFLERPSAERLGLECFDFLTSCVSRKDTVHEVKVYESPDAYATIRRTR